MYTTTAAASQARQQATARPQSRRQFAAGCHLQQYEPCTTECKAQGLQQKSSQQRKSEVLLLSLMVGVNMPVLCPTVVLTDACRHHPFFLL
jgi:hypothetical protein